MKQFSSSVNIFDKHSTLDTNDFFRVRGHNDFQNVLVGVPSAIFSLREDRARNV